MSFSSLLTANTGNSNTVQPRYNPVFGVNKNGQQYKGILMKRHLVHYSLQIQVTIILMKPLSFRQLTANTGNSKIKLTTHCKHR